MISYKRTNRVRLLLRMPIWDARGDVASHEHSTIVAEIPVEHPVVVRDLRPEIIGGEWLYDVEESEEDE